MFTQFGLFDIICMSGLYTVEFGDYFKPNALLLTHGILKTCSMINWDKALKPKLILRLQTLRNNMAYNCISEYFAK